MSWFLSYHCPNCPLVTRPPPLCLEVVRFSLFSLLAISLWFACCSCDYTNIGIHFAFATLLPALIHPEFPNSDIDFDTLLLYPPRAFLPCNAIIPLFYASSLCHTLYFHRAQIFYAHQDAFFYLVLNVFIGWHRTLGHASFFFGKHFRHAVSSFLFLSISFCYF